MVSFKEEGEMMKGKETTSIEIEKRMKNLYVFVFTFNNHKEIDIL
jgi:hypothetical protein